MQLEQKEIEKGPKSHRGFSTKTKSNTTINLPGINKLSKFSQKTKTQNRSSYIETISFLSGNVQYDNKKPSQISKEHTKLRNILKKMNDQTLHIIDQLKPKHFETKPTRQQLSLVRDRQIDNNKKMIANLSYEIEKLKQKHNKIVQHQQRQQLQHKIKEIKGEMQLMQNRNISSKLDIFKDGKQIVRQMNDQYDIKLSLLENDKYLFEIKLQKLRKDNNKVLDDLKKLQSKFAEQEGKSKLYEQEFNALKTHQFQENKQKNKFASIKIKRFQYQTLKKKIQSIKTHQQYKYYKLLKDLQYQTKSSDLVKNKIFQFNERIQTGKSQINILQKKLKALKQNKLDKSRIVLQYLQKQRKMKQESSLNGGGQSMFLLHNGSIMDEIKEKINTQSVVHNKKWESQPNRQQNKSNQQQYKQNHETTQYVAQFKAQQIESEVKKISSKVDEQQVNS